MLQFSQLNLVCVFVSRCVCVCVWFPGKYLMNNNSSFSFHCCSGIQCKCNFKQHFVATQSNLFVKINGLQCACAKPVWPPNHYADTKCRVFFQNFIPQSMQADNKIKQLVQKKKKIGKRASKKKNHRSVSNNFHLGCSCMWFLSPTYTLRRTRLQLGAWNLLTWYKSFPSSFVTGDKRNSKIC